MTPVHRHDDDDTGISVQSGVSVFTGAGYVQLRWGEQAGQLTPDDARAHAMSILSAAEAAETDAAFFALCKAGGADDEAAAGMLLHLRRTREGMA